LRFVPERLLVGHFPPEGKQREVLKEFVWDVELNLEWMGLGCEWPAEESDRGGWFEGEGVEAVEMVLDIWLSEQIHFYWMFCMIWKRVRWWLDKVINEGRAVEGVGLEGGMCHSGWPFAMFRCIRKLEMVAHLRFFI
jgi:hypothetical protein